MTFYEALNEFEARYLSALAVDSKRVVDLLDQDWQTIDNEFNCYTTAVSEGNTTDAADHLQVIIDTLSNNGIVVNEPISLPYSPTISTVPSSIAISCDSLGVPQSGAFDSAFSYVYIYLGSSEDTANWTYVITDTTDVTANNSTTDNKIEVTAIAADTGSVEVTCSKTGYDDFVIYVVVYKEKVSLTGVLLTTGNQTASGIKTWSTQHNYTNGFLVTGGNISCNSGVDFNLSQGDITMDGKIVQSGVSSEYEIEPLVALAVGKETNNAGFGVHVYRGDGTAVINHNLEGVGDSYVCGNNGNFGIGDTTPSEKLEVTGNVLASGNITTEGRYLTNSNEISESYDITSTVTVTPVATSNNLFISVQGDDTPITCTLNVDLDNYQDATMLPVFISLNLVANYNSISFVVNFRNSSDVTIESVSDSLNAGQESHWGIILQYATQTYGGSDWYVLSPANEA